MKRFLIIVIFITAIFISPLKIFAETQDESQLVSIIRNASPSVVTIEIIEKQKSDSSNPFDMKVFNSITKWLPTVFNTSVEKKPIQSEDNRNIGTGFVVSPGIVVTNKHVVSDKSAKYKIVTKDKKSFDAKDIYRDPSKEIAIIKFSEANLPVLKLGDSDKVKVGQTAIAIGTPFGELYNTVTTGIISALDRDIKVQNPDTNKEDSLKGMIQTSAPFNFGNSGGPLLNSSGEVIGINTVTTLMGQNIGFSIPINDVKQDLEKLDIKIAPTSPDL